MPGCWEGETSQYKVSFNPHRFEHGGVPPNSFALIHKTRSTVAVVSAHGGVVAAGDEAEIIAHLQTEIEALRVEGAA